MPDPVPAPAPGAPSPRPPRILRTAWPLRPGLSALLLAVVLASLAFVAGAVRERTTLGGMLASALHLAPLGPPSAPAPRTALVLGDEPDLRIVLSPAATPIAPIQPAAPGDASADQPAAPEQPLAPEQQAALDAAPAAPAHLWSLHPELAEGGTYAPTRATRRLLWHSAPLRGTPPLSIAQQGAAREAIADALARDRARYRPYADLLRATAGASGTAEAERTIVRGWVLNALTLAAAVGFVLSLASRPNQLITTWDELMAHAAGLGPVALLALLWGSAPAVLGIALLLNLGPLSDLLQVNPLLGWFGYVCVFIVSAGVGFLPTYGQSMLGGWVFGLWAGFPGAMLGFVGGSVIGYVIAQRVSRHKIEDLIDKNPKSKAVRDALLGHGFWRTLGIVTLIRLPPNSPFALTNLVMASAGVRFVPYVLGTAIGMAPRTFLAAALAAAGRATGARDIQEFITEQPWWALPAGLAAMAICLGVIGLIASHALKQVTASTATTRTTPDSPPHST